MKATLGSLFFGGLFLLGFFATNGYVFPAGVVQSALVVIISWPLFYFGFSGSTNGEPEKNKFPSKAERGSRGDRDSWYSTPPTNGI